MKRARYAVQIDISAKLESYDKVSILAVGNENHCRALFISPEVKVRAAALLGSEEPPQYRLMAILAYIALRPELECVNRITLDRDYSGPQVERLIVRYLVELIRRDFPRFKASAIRIDNVAGSAADRLARAVYRKRKEPNGEIVWADIEAVLQG